MYMVGGYTTYLTPEYVGNINSPFTPQNSTHKNSTPIHPHPTYLLSVSNLFSFNLYEVFRLGTTVNVKWRFAMKSKCVMETTLNIEYRYMYVIRLRNIRNNHVLCMSCNNIFFRLHQFLLLNFFLLNVKSLKLIWELFSYVYYDLHSLNDQIDCWRCQSSLTKLKDLIDFTLNSYI